MHTKSLINDARELSKLLRPTWPGITAAIERSGVPTCQVAEAPLKDKLKRIESQIAEARAERPDLVKTRDEARDAYAGIEDLSPESDEFKEAQEAVRALGECDDRIANLQAVQIGTLRMLGQDAPVAAGQDRAAGDPIDPRGWNSASLFADEKVREALTHAATSKGHIGPLELGQVMSRDALAADVAPSSDMRRGQWLGVVGQLRQAIRVLDLIPTGTMDENTLPYTRESGSFTTAKPVKEGETKAESGVTFEDDEAVARTIAHWMKIRKQALADVSALRSIIDSRLRYGLERILESEVLAGKGADPELTGILHATGIGVVKFKAGELVTDQVLRSLTTILLANAQGTGIVMHPLDWQEALLAKSKFEASAGVQGGSGEYYSGGPFSVTPQQMWGVPLVPSVAISQGAPLAGDFDIGAQLFIREGINVLMSDSDQDDFIKNRLTMLGEMRAALAVFRPAAFCRAFLTKAAEEAG